MATPELSLRDVHELAAARRLTSFLGLGHGVPAVIVHLTDEAGLRAAAPPELLLLPAVVIGVPDPTSAAGTGGEVVDLVAADLDDAHALAEAVARTRSAAVSLALLLRGGADRSVEAGLVAESTTYSMLQGSAEFATWRSSRARRARVADAGPPVRVERDGSDLHVVLQRTHRHNAVDTALSEQLVAALTDALSDAVTDPDLRVVLRGDGPSFCSGGDLDEFGSFPDVALAHAARLSRSAGHLVHLLRDRIEVRLHGSCIGAGIEIPAFAGRVVAAPTTRIVLPELALGLVPGAGGTVSIPRRIGRQRTLALALADAPLDAAAARSWGLVDELDEA